MLAFLVVMALSFLSENALFRWRSLILRWRSSFASLLPVGCGPGQALTVLVGDVPRQQRFWRIDAESVREGRCACDRRLPGVLQSRPELGN